MPLESLENLEVLCFLEHLYGRWHLEHLEYLEVLCSLVTPEHLLPLVHPVYLEVLCFLGLRCYPYLLVNLVNLGLPLNLEHLENL